MTITYRQAILNVAQLKRMMSDAKKQGKLTLETQCKIYDVTMDLMSKIADEL